MTKKEYILKILEKLKDDWLLAKWLAKVIWEVNDEKLLNSMYKIFNKVVNNISDEKIKEKFNKSVLFVKKKRLAEKNEKQENFEELDILEKELENLI